MGPIEIFALMVFAFSIIAGLVGDSMAKGIVAAALGLLCATVGLDPENSTPRFIFGHFELYDGIPLVSIALGMLAVAELLRRISLIRGKIGAAVSIPESQDSADRRISWAEYWSCRYTILRGSCIGTILGPSGAGFLGGGVHELCHGQADLKRTRQFRQGEHPGDRRHGIGQQFGVRGQPHPPAHPGNSRQHCRRPDHFRPDDSRYSAGPPALQRTGQLIYGLFGALIMANILNLFSGFSA